MHAFAALIASVGAGIGYPLLFAAIAAEAAGVPVPGETALITASVAASHHPLHIVLVIAVAAAAAILGDNAGYLFGRRIGRRLLRCRARWPGIAGAYWMSAIRSLPATGRRPYF